MLDWVGILSVAVTAFLDAAVIPISVQALLIGIALAYPKWAWVLVGVYASASVAGACVGYWLGRYGLAAPLLQRFPTEKLKLAETQMRHYGPFIVAFGGTTPIPFPLFTITAGMFRVSLPALLLGVFIGRGAKAALFVLASAHVGHPALKWLKKFPFALAPISLALVIGAGIWWRRRKSKEIKQEVKIMH